MAHVTAGTKRALPRAARALWASQSPPTRIASSNLYLPAVLSSLPAGICTECGVCDDEEEAAQEGGQEGSSASRGFGRNVVYEPPPIPEFEGHYRPNSTRAQRLRFRCALPADGSPGAKLLACCRHLRPATSPHSHASCMLGAGSARRATWCL